MHFGLAFTISEILVFNIFHLESLCESDIIQHLMANIRKEMSHHTFLH